MRKRPAFFRSKMKKVDRWNTPGTADTPDNADGGVLIVLPPGWGPEKRPGEEEPKARGLITSAQIDRGPLVPICLHWLERAGLPVRRNVRSFSVAVWPKMPLENVRGPQMVPKLVAAGEDVLAECRRRHPRLVIFLSCYLFDAFRDTALADEVSDIFGAELEKTRRLTRRRLRAEVVRYERALVLGLPLPSQNTTSVIVEDLVEGLTSLFRVSGLR